MGKKGKYIYVLVLIFLLIGISLLSYPVISTVINQYRQDEIIQQFNSKVKKLKLEEQLDQIKIAKKYNKDQQQLNADDPLNPGVRATPDYYKILKIDNSEVMGILQIPKIKLKLPIYHGTDADILAKGIGHLPTSSYPVGGKNTHSVLTGHSGDMNFNRFDDLDKLQKNDYFTIQIFNQHRTYIIDQIKIVKPNNITDLQIFSQQEYVTLITCTPYGVNSHRLLIRGHYSKKNIKRKLKEKYISNECFKL